MISTTYPNKVGKYVLLQKPWQHWHQSHIEFWTVKPFKAKNWVCLTATVPNIDFQPPKRQQTKSNGIHHKHERTETVCHTRLKNGLKGAVRHNDTTNCIVYNRNTKLQFYLPPILKFPDFYGRTNSIKYNSIITLEAQIYQNCLSMTHPTISNTNHSVSSKTSTTTQSRLCKIGVCPWHTTNCVKHKSDAHASTHVCVCAKHWEDSTCKCFLNSMIFKSIKTDQIRKQNPANVPWDTFFPKKQV